MEGNRLTHDQTRYIFETNTIGVEKEVLNVDDVIETANLKNGTSDSRKDWFAVGDYKKLPNEVGGRYTALPEGVADKMKTFRHSTEAKKDRGFAVG